MGKRARRPGRPAARQRALGRQVLDARDDGHRPQPRPQRRVGARAWPRRPATSASPTTPTAASSPMYGAHRARRRRASTSTRLLEHRQGLGRRRRRRRDPRRDAAGACASRYKERRARRRPARRSRRSPTVQLRGAIEAVFRSWGGARAVAYREREHIPDDLGTAVNVQTMVFGNRDERLAAPASASPATPSTGEAAPYGDFLAQRAGRGRRGRHPQHRGPRRHQAHVPDDPRRAAGHLRPARAPLPRHVRHRVHHRAGQALDAPDPRRQAHRRGRAAHGRRHDQADAAGSSRRPRPSSASPPSTSTRCCTRSSRRGKRDGHRHRAWPPRRAPRSAASTSPPTTRVDGRRARRAGHPRPQRDLARGRARHAGGRGHPHRARRPREPRRGRRPRLGHPGGGGCRGASRSAARRSPSAASSVRRGRRHLPRRHHRRGRARRGGAGRGRAARGVRHDPRLGRRDPEGQARRCGPTPTPARTPTIARQLRRRGHRPVPHRAHVPRPRIGCRSCGA